MVVYSSDELKVEQDKSEIQNEVSPSVENIDNVNVDFKVNEDQAQGITGNEEIPSSGKDYATRILGNVTRLGELKRMVRDNCDSLQDSSDSSEGSDFSLLTEDLNIAIENASKAESKVTVEKDLKKSHIQNDDVPEVRSTVDVQSEPFSNKPPKVIARQRNVPVKVTSVKRDIPLSNNPDAGLCATLSNFKVPSSRMFIVCSLVCLAVIVKLWKSESALTGSLSKATHQGLVLNPSVPLADRLKDLEMKIVHCLSQQSRDENLNHKTKFMFCLKETGKWYLDFEAYMKQDTLREFLSSAQDLYSKETVSLDGVSHVDVELVIRQMEHSELLPKLLTQVAVSDGNANDETRGIYLILTKALREILQLKQLNEYLVSKTTQLMEKEELTEDITSLIEVMTKKLKNDGLMSVNKLEATLSDLKLVVDDLIIQTNEEQESDVVKKLQDMFAKLISESRILSVMKKLLISLFTNDSKVNEVIEYAVKFHQNIMMPIFVGGFISVLGYMTLVTFTSFDSSCKFLKTVCYCHLVAFLWTGTVYCICSMHLWVCTTLIFE